MKTSIFLLSIFLVALNLHSQNYEITFTGSGASPSVEHVKVVYLSKGDTLDISGSDVLRLVRSTTQINSSLPGDNGLMVYPNPIRDESRISFYSSSAGVVNLEVFDIAGKLIVKNRQYLPSGNQNYSLSGLSTGLYTLRVNCMEGLFSARIISIGKNTGVPFLKHENSELVLNAEGNLKSRLNVVELEYTDEDWLLLKGASGNYQRIVTIAPTESGTVDFEFMACTDNDNNHYPVVTIGAQTWMAENLRTGTFSDGSEITHLEYNFQWGGASIPAYCWYNNDSENEGLFGKLYNWFVAGSDKNPCPQGWHVPGYNEYMVLHYYLTENGFNFDGSNWVNDNQGKAAKALAHIMLWNHHTRNGAVGNNLLLNNKTGFSLLPHGCRRPDGSFTNPGEWCFLWLATEVADNQINAHNYLLRYDREYNENWTEPKKRGMAIRCIKD